MNPVFWLLVVLVLVFIWTILIPFFRIVGKVIFSIMDRLDKTMFDYDNNVDRRKRNKR